MCLLFSTAENALKMLIGYRNTMQCEGNLIMSKYSELRVLSKPSSLVVNPAEFLHPPTVLRALSATPEMPETRRWSEPGRGSLRFEVQVAEVQMIKACSLVRDPAAWPMRKPLWFV